VPVLPPRLEQSGEFPAKAELPQDALGVMAESHGAGQGVGLRPAFHHAHAQAALAEQQCEDLPDRPGSRDEDVAVVLIVLVVGHRSAQRPHVGLVGVGIR
jgi:hypothetical protein